jgi:pimeloyl-ACP methyl ester carboxylesterase
MKYLPKFLLFSSLLGLTSALIAEDNPFPGKKSKWQGFDMFQDGGRKVIVPVKVAEGKPWVWRARFFGHQPQFDVALLKRGYHLVYCEVGGLFGSDQAVERWNAFYKYLREEHGFAEKVVLEGMSRGGLIIYNWGIANPEKVAVIYGDAPVMDFKSWPGAGSGGILKSYGFKNAEEAKAYKRNPVDSLKSLADAGVPIIHVVGDADTVVPVSENTAVAEKRYHKMGGTFKVIHKKKVGHHPHSLKDPAPLVDFVLKHTSGKKDK